MKKFSLFFLATLSLAALAQPVSIEVPARESWCVSSQPIEMGADTGKYRFGDLVFYELYERLERAALKSDVASIGVPFLEGLKEDSSSLTPTPSSSSVAKAPSTAKPSSATPAPRPTPKFVMRVCANVPSGTPSAAADLNVEALTFPKSKVYASLCDASDEGPCRQQIQERIEEDLKLNPEQISKLDWRVSQSIDGRAEATAILSSLTDSTIRQLSEGKQAPKVPRDKLVMWAAP